ncbi:hypothetical protein [Microbacterium sp. NIBRBAC000506063]|uniref:hypothetical protein n=1 Tax=Microbacterium sp. NIBRBAC000506063 TaxID=2734618 RepID=UPI001BB5F10D|nr:hypothetical protein [Microbacterium sp. NIBRBAC000506063]QTV79203.1 hypothetical protein KAE78_09035 [Microbacterium sp. NIBRBAC000506063]
MLLATGAVIALGQVSDYDLLLLGTSMIFAATAAAVLLPWERLPYVLSALIPAVDVIAIALLRPATTGAAMGVLWVFPAMWAAWSYGLAGMDESARSRAAAAPNARSARSRERAGTPRPGAVSLTFFTVCSSLRAQKRDSEPDAMRRPARRIASSALRRPAPYGVAAVCFTVNSMPSRSSDACCESLSTSSPKGKVTVTSTGMVYTPGPLKVAAAVSKDPVPPVTSAAPVTKAISKNSTSPVIDDSATAIAPRMWSPAAATTRSAV